MTKKIFATGATGYIGGDAIYALLSASPEYEVSCLVRSGAKATELVARHPSVRIVDGTLDDLELLEEAAANADIVCNFAHATHEPSVSALAKGLARRQRPGHGYLIHTMGSGTMIYDDVIQRRFGEHSDKVFNDVEGLPEVLAVPDFAKARGAENAVRDVGVKNPDRVRTAVVCTGSAYGPGRGLVEYRTSAIHELVRCTLSRGHALQVGAGKSAWRNVYIRDLSDVFVKLITHATNDEQDSDNTDESVWGGSGGYYFVENGEHVWGELARAISDEAVAQGLIQGGDIESIDAAEAASLAPMCNFFWGCNARVEGRRAARGLNWKPVGPPLVKELEVIVQKEAEKLGLS
uniref:Oxidase ucsJ n=1 Tax=Acremonium sp. TaxID=2046025 RepID=UCSJ_ACRSP|nr:RecName: Full=Oxidase ucsJ; AltName: Full=UCS1025A pyrrolizidinone biosynthesis cluster protein J [Acremonium sp.]QBC88154.1 UcsJ [Acremonium sp.]